MKIILFASVLLLIFCLSNAALFLEPPHPNRRNGGCYSDNVGHLTGGEKKTVQGKCLRASCVSSGTIEYASCGVVQVSGRCKLIEEKNKPYPDCCPKVTKC